MKIIALCINVEELDHGGFKDQEVCKKYPGSGWMPWLVQYAKQTGVLVHSGSETIRLIMNHDIQISDVLVVQEELNRNAQTLLGLGAEPGIVFCLESPLYAPYFYDAIPLLNRLFPIQLLFDYGTHLIKFPSFDLNDIREPKPFEGRDKSCMVVSNKYYKLYEDLFKNSPVWKIACQRQLHDARLSIIERLHGHADFDLYGHGWGDKAKSILPGKKVEVMRDYLINYSLENIYMKGYLTEKLFDALMAGCAPVYVGASNIADLVPHDIILDEKSDNIERVINNGHKFLQSKVAREHSYQGFAAHFLDLLEHVADNARSKKRNSATKHQTDHENLSTQVH